LRRRYEELFGYGPKRLERILRFQRFLTSVRSAPFFETAWSFDTYRDNSPYLLDRALRGQPSDDLAFGRTFTHDVVTVSGDVRIHYVTGGSGPALVLLHGFPQRWREWRLIMPRLADAGYTVLAPDLRGFGARLFAEDLTGAVAERSGHWIPEERPAWLADQIIQFLGQKTSSEAARYQLSHQS